MNRDEYLKTLEGLLTSLSDGERKDILYDYREHFDSRLAEGKTEAEIITALGQPSKVAKPYISKIPDIEILYEESSDKQHQTSQNNEPTLQDNLQNLGKQFVDRTKEFVDKVSTDGKDIGSNLSETGKKVGKELHDRGIEIGENLKETGQKFGSQFKDTAEDVGRNIKSSTSKVVNDLNASVSSGKKTETAVNKDVPMATHVVTADTARSNVQQTVTRVTASEQAHMTRKPDITTKSVRQAKPKGNNPLAMIFIMFFLFILSCILIGPYIGLWAIVISFFAVSIVLFFGGFALLVSSIASVPVAIMNISIMFLDHPIFLVASSLILISLGGLLLILTFYLGKGFAYIGYYYIKWSFKAIRGY